MPEFTIFRHFFLCCAQRGFRPVLCENLERSARNDLEGPVFLYLHLKATLTSGESRLDMAGASKDVLNSVVYAGTKSVLSIWFPRWGGYGCTCATIFAGTGRDTHTKDPTAAAMQPSSLRPEVLRTPGSGGKEHVETTVSTTQPSSRRPEAIRIPSSGGKEPSSNATVFAGTRSASHTRFRR